MILCNIEARRIRDVREARYSTQIVAPNPLNKAKYVVIIGMSTWGPLNGWKVHPSKDGASDYVVFDLEGAKPRQHAEYFDTSAWQRPNAATAVRGPQCLGRTEWERK